MTGADLKAWRQRHGVNQLGASVAIGCSVRAYGEYEKAGKVPHIVVLATEALDARVAAGKALTER